jgi:ATP synthase F0 subunit b
MTLALTIFLFFLETAEGGASWFNVPGFELWRIFNLTVFLLFLYFILKKPLSAAFQSRRENIRRELTRAQEEKAAAQAKLLEVEERLSRLNAEVEAIKTKAQQEAGEEQERITRATNEELKRLRDQTQREIEVAGKAARQDLQRYAAEQSVELASAMLRREIRPEDDARLMKNYLAELGGAGR